MRSANQTAILLAVMLKRSEQNRARLSRVTVRTAALREILRAAFVRELSDEMAEFGWIVCELGSGGFGAIQASILEAAKPVTVRRYLTVEERRAAMRDVVDWNALEAEVRPERPEAEEDE